MYILGMKYAISPLYLKIKNRERHISLALFQYKNNVEIG